jgi:hypothetical protein
VENHSLYSFCFAERFHSHEAGDCFYITIPTKRRSHGSMATRAVMAGRPNSNAVKFFNAVKLLTLLTDREWLDEAGNKNARRNGLNAEKLTDDIPADSVCRSKNHW